MTPKEIAAKLTEKCPNMRVSEEGGFVTAVYTYTTCIDANQLAGETNAPLADQFIQDTVKVSLALAKAAK